MDSEISPDDLVVREARQPHTQCTFARRTLLFEARVELALV